LRLVEGHRHAGEFASWLAGRQLREVEGSSAARIRSIEPALLVKLTGLTPEIGTETAAAAEPVVAEEAPAAEEAKPAGVIRRFFSAILNCLLP
jgi:hypothetical protein